MTPIDAARLAAMNAPRLRPTGATAPAGPAPAGSGFRVEEAAEGETTEAAVSVVEAAPVSLGLMLAAEALERKSARDRAARRHGQVVLAGLTTLQRALLDGGDHTASLDRLAALVADMPQATEAQLAALLGTIVLRARVELARLGR